MKVFESKYQCKVGLYWVNYVEFVRVNVVFLHTLSVKSVQTYQTIELNV